MSGIILTDAPEVEEVTNPHESWEVLLIEREMFGEKRPQYPWIRHQQIEPKIKLHLVDPLKHGKPEDDKYTCVCGDPIPQGVMRKFFLLMSTL